MKKTIKVDLPERAALAAAHVVRVAPAFAADLDDAERALRATRDRFGRVNARVEELRESVARGAAQPTALENALMERSAAALAIAPGEARVQQARATLAAAEQRAREAVVTEAGRWRDELQAVADQLAPVLEELRTLEAALDRAVVAAAPALQGVPPLEWPSTLGADATLHFIAATR